MAFFKCISSTKKFQNNSKNLRNSRSGAYHKVWNQTFLPSKLERNGKQNIIFALDWESLDLL